MTIDILIGNYLRNKRTQKSYSQEYLAYKLKISQNAYSKIELGISKLTVKRLFEILDLLDLSINDFLEEISIQRNNFPIPSKEVKI